MCLHIYADDTQIYTFFSAKSSDSSSLALANLESCIKSVRTWMLHAKLKLNDDKTDFIVISSPYFQNKLTHLSLTMGDIVIESAEKVRNLGVIFDRTLDMKDQVASVCKASFFQLRNISAIRKYLSDEACAQLIHAFVTSRIDYCNSLLVNLPNSQYAKLQKVQNVAARILTLSGKYEHISPVLIKLHWLPIPLRIQYKVLLLAFKCINGNGPSYLTELLHQYTPPRTLRSSTQNLLEIPSYKMVTYGKRAFSVAVPLLWNNLPVELRSCNDVVSFKSGLKTHLFKSFVDDPGSFIMK